ncbi:MAG: SUMF1/EgtB/PvdO family nonheme iron enzyme [Planctomycetes bacterium]|nr:SUMF1/EgtB/PvdO family nonheme iron enzyme [Planctomycetota bacterium]
MSDQTDPPQPDPTPLEPNDERVLAWLDRLAVESDAADFEFERFLAGVPADVRDEVRRLSREVAWVRRLVSTSVAGDAPRVAPGERIGDYELIRELGHGSMGVVYLARQLSLDRRVAVKLLQPLSLFSVHQVERFRREAKSAARLNHPGLVQVPAVGEERGLRFFVMEYVPGRTLHEELESLRKRHTGGAPPASGDQLGTRDGRPYVEQAATIAALLADALEHAHQHGVIHRDVKPHNVLMTEDGSPMLADFGLAKDIVDQSLSREGDIAGTPSYMSPEQARADRERIDKRTDVFSLGVVLYEMLSLSRPFAGKSSHEVMQRIVTFEPPPLDTQNPRVPAELAVICRKAMEKRREDRYASAAEFAADLRRFLAGEPIHARPPTLAQTARRWVRRHRVLSASFAVGAVALVLGVGGSQLRTTLAKRAELPRIALVGVPDGVDVFVRHIDPARGTIGPREDLGTTPLEAFRLEPGVWRIVLVSDDAFAELTRTLDAGDELTLTARLVPTAATRVDMTLVPEADFVYGEASNQRVGPRSIEHAPAVYLDDTEVTNRAYREFVDATGHVAPDLWSSGYESAWDELPVVGVTSYDARDFAEWAGKRLPTEFEWEHAARGEDGRMYPWGDDERLLASAARLDGSRSPTIRRAQFEQYLAHVEPVRTRPEGRSPYGHWRMLDNVNEYSESTFVENVEGERKLHFHVPVVMGGSFMDAPGEWRLSFRGDMHPGASHHFVGFRCAKSATP